MTYGLLCHQLCKGCNLPIFYISHFERKVDIFPIKNKVEIKKINLCLMDCIAPAEVKMYSL